MINQYIRQNRSYRRFEQSVRIEEEQLLDWINNARLSGSAANLQQIRYFYTVEPIMCEELFPMTAWAGYLPDWKGPEEGERPTGYIILTAPNMENRMLGIDVGIASQSILLSATEAGFGGCMIGAFNREAVTSIVPLAKAYVPWLIIALGKPKESVHLEDISIQESVKYYRDDHDVHHVPKLKLSEIVRKL